MNHLCNPKEKTGEIMMSIIMQGYPDRVNKQLLAKIMHQKNQYSLLLLHESHNALQNNHAKSPVQMKAEAEQSSEVEQLVNNY